MSYYFIGLDPARLKTFLKRFSFLADGKWIENLEELSELHDDGEMKCFIVHLAGDRPQIDEFVLKVREKFPSAKVIYVTEESTAHDLKSHQLTPVGGDAYVSFNVNVETLFPLLEGLMPKELNSPVNRLEESSGKDELSLAEVEQMRNHPLSIEIDELFKSVIKPAVKKPLWQTLPQDEVDISGEDMSDKDQELSLDDLADLEISSDNEPVAGEELDEGLDLGLDEDDEGLSLDEGEEEAEIEEESIPENLGELDLLSGDEGGLEELSLGESQEEALDLGADDFTLPASDDDSLNLGDDDLALSGEEDLLSLGGDDLSDDAKEKLKEIDAIMDDDSSKVGLTMDLGGSDDEIESLDEPLVSEDLNLSSLDFEEEEQPEVQEEKPKRKKKEAPDRHLGQDLKEISTAYSGEMERTQATIANLRADRQELLAKIQQLEEDKVLQNRQTLTLRAELDEKKIELSIMRKKLNDEITDLRDRLKVFDEKKLILEEKNRLLTQELDKSAQRNKLDVKKVQMREKELEQKLELLKSDAETQIKNRDLKILELKRKLDAMEFDMESISLQEKRSVESRFELEDKLDKAIKTLRSAITVLENESDKGGALEALKKNIDM